MFFWSPLAGAAPGNRCWCAEVETGLAGPFLFLATGARELAGILRDRLIALIEPLLASLGYELIELEYGAGRSQGTLRIFIDQPQGIRVEDCEKVSREVSALLDVEDPIPSAYSLEVSSPGEDRVLRKREHFERFVGSRVFVELKAPRDGRRRYTGTLLSVVDEGVVIEVDRQQVELPLAEIGKARLAPLS